jgi:hypothetical protein
MIVVGTFVLPAHAFMITVIIIIILENTPFDMSGIRHYAGDRLTHMLGTLVGNHVHQPLVIMVTLDMVLVSVLRPVVCMVLVIISSSRHARPSSDDCDYNYHSC